MKKISPIPGFVRIYISPISTQKFMHTEHNKITPFALPPPLSEKERYRIRDKKRLG
jgi:hypothetical protein